MEQNKLSLNTILYAIGAFITTLGIEQLILYGSLKMVVYHAISLDAWVVPYTMLTYGIIFLLYAYKFGLDAPFIYIVTYVTWDSQAFQNLIVNVSINPFYITFATAAIPSLIYIYRNYRVKMSWALFTGYFLGFPILATLEILLNSKSFLYESIYLMVFSLFIFSILEKRTK